MSQDQKALEKEVDQNSLVEKQDSESIFMEGFLKPMGPGVYLFTQT